MAQALFVAHLPVMVIDGLIAGSAIAFLWKVSPGLLDASAQIGVRGEAARV